MKIKIIEQHKDMDIDLFESISNEFTTNKKIVVINIRVNFMRDGLLKAVIIYREKSSPATPREIGNRL